MEYDINVTELSEGNEELFTGITNMMHKTGISANMKGHDYIRSALLLIVNYPELRYKITTLIYPLLAEKYNVTPSMVERNIRSCVERAWAVCDTDTLYELFGNTIAPDKGRPTNSEFLALVADVIGIKLKDNV